MTNLELLICEAENNGEISIDIRDRLLEVINENKNHLNDYEVKVKKITSTLYSGEKVLSRIDEEIKRIDRECKKDGATSKNYLYLLSKLLYDLITRYEKLIVWRNDSSDSEEIIKETQSKYEEVKSNTKRLIKLIIDKFSYCLRKTSNFTSDLKNAEGVVKRLDDVIIHKKYILKNDVNFFIDMKRNLESNIKMIKYHKESSCDDFIDLKLSIYESELCGDITPEERKLLLLELE